MSLVGYLGPKGTFTEMAVDGLFSKWNKISYQTIPACIDAVGQGEVDLGVVPIENAIEGSVHLTIDYLTQKAQVPIIAEVILPIKQHLFIHPELDLDFHQIEKVYSHSHAIAQCQQYLHQHLSKNVTFEYTSSTGQAAEIVKEVKKPYAAIGNILAAEEYGLKVLDENIHDYPNNHTRFVVVQRDKKPIEMNDLEPKGYKTTIMVTLPSDFAGALHQVLAAFSWRKMNLSKIESRPMKTGLGNYFFIIDVDQAYDYVLFPGVQQELEALGCKMTILGTYPSFQINI